MPLPATSRQRMVLWPESELRLLEEIRYELDIDRLHAAAIERGARARHAHLIGLGQIAHRTA